MSESGTSQRARGGLADKRRAILAGALRVFARDGYTRASVDAIAAEAGVSTRTIYNHFADKAELFGVVIQESAARAAEVQVAIIERHLAKILDLEEDLIAFGLEFAVLPDGYAEHFALVRQIRAEAEHIPDDAITAWQETGPRHVRRVLGRHLAAAQDRGLLRIGSPELAASQLMSLLSIVNPTYLGARPSHDEIVRIVTAGVHVFLHGYLPPTGESR